MHAEVKNTKHPTKHHARDLKLQVILMRCPHISRHKHINVGIHIGEGEIRCF